MLEFLIIFAVAVGGFFHVPIVVVAIAAAGLFAMSYWRYHAVYERGLGMGLNGLMLQTAVSSGWHAVIASGMAYGGGWFIWIVTIR
jgi:hypothetical protein